MLSDGVHGAQDYINFSRSKIFDSVCCVNDVHSNISQTGVLIAPDIVATAAHGVAHMIPSSYRPNGDEACVIPVDTVIVGFGSYFSSGYTYKVVAVVIDPRYLQKEYVDHGKFDIAFLRLEREVRGIKPAILFDKAEIPNDATLIVGTFGTSDLTEYDNFKRAFMLLEMDIYQHSSNDLDVFSPVKSLSLSSIFFKPTKELPEAPSLQENESVFRSYDANKKWHELNNPPYALALSGTSGAPVFVELMVNGKIQEYLFGIVTSFSTLSDYAFHSPKGINEREYILREKRENIYGRYQTIFALFYQLEDNYLKENSKKRSYRKDYNLTELLDKLKSYKVAPIKQTSSWLDNIFSFFNKIFGNRNH